MKYYILILLLVCPAYVNGQDNTLSIIPEPASVVTIPQSFKLNSKKYITYNDATAKETAGLLNEFLFTNYGFRLKRVASKATSGQGSISIWHDHKSKAESYELIVRQKGIRLTGDAAGIFYGLQTLQQIFPLEKTNTIILPGVQIKDEPRFAYRGLMLDVSRHFFPVSYIKKFLNIMAQYKFNNFHWHLTDDQGWRIEIKKYPELQHIGAWREPTSLEEDSPQIKNGRYGGYYTQKQIKEVVAYALARHINIVPEIEMPGHSNAALASYPNLGCINQQYKVLTGGTISSNVYCVGNDDVFKFLQDVIDEVVALFPGKYIHIGGDETPKDRWKQCAKCQARIKAEGLKDENELQSYFVQRIEKYINSKGRRMIGWDEILEGGLAPNATVMSWRGETGGIEAARLHHDVIMTPYTFVYFDYYQGRQRELEPHATGAYLPLSKVYSYDPVPSSLTEDQRKYIKGVQANTWAEQIPNEAHADYMVYPRALAVAEIGWSPATKKNYTNFLQKLSVRLASLDQQQVNFRIPEPVGLKDSVALNDHIEIKLQSAVSNATVYYTTDGTTPTVNSSKNNQGINLLLPDNKPVVVKAITILPSGRQSTVYQATYVKKP